MASTKHKNTYIVKIDGIMANLQAFAMCDHTPLPVVTFNGAPVKQNAGGWMNSVRFPNPGASYMQSEYNSIVPHFGEKLASTIVEYLDKDNGAPVAYLYPTIIAICDGYDETYEKHLNHATRRDLANQITKRRIAWSKMNLQNQR